VKNLCGRLPVIGFCLFAAAAVVQAQTWVNLSGGSWGAGANWSGGAVPTGTALVALTNAHAGAVTVTLDANRSQTVGMLFGGGDWSVQPGVPDTSTLTLGGTITNLDGVTTLGVAGGTAGGGKVTKRGPGELVIAAERTFVNTPSVEEGVLRVAPEGVIRTGATWDTFVDGTGTLLVDGGRVETKIIRLGQDVMTDGALFRMTSGTVNCGGSGDASLLIGYQSGTPLQGSAMTEILGGTFAATGLVSNAGVFIGSQQPGTLVVAGTNGVPAAMDVGRIWFGWKDSSRNFATTNVFVIESNAVVSASVAVLKQMPLCRGDLYLRAGGTLLTPTVYSVAGPLAFHFEGGRLELTAPSNTLFAGSGVGKSSLLGSFARGVHADVVVLALVGERGRELRAFVEDVLGPEGMARSVVVAATSDQSPLVRRRCMLAAMTVAEHFRDRGLHVLFLADSITRFAEAHREVALAAGESAALRGYPPSLSHAIMSLAERAGPGAEGAGDITAVLSVLVAGSDMDEPVADILRGTIDGHVVLDRRIAERGRFPAVDLLRSVSRSLPDCALVDENAAITETRRLLGAWDRAELMVQSGLYAAGSDPLTDRAIRLYPALDAFLAEAAPQGGIQAGFVRLAGILAQK